MTDDKQIDFFTMPYCKPCKPALATVKKVASKHGYKVKVIDIIKTKIDRPIAIPLACISKIDKNGKKKRVCIEGYGSGYQKDIENLVKK